MATWLPYQTADGDKRLYVCILHIQRKRDSGKGSLDQKLYKTVN